MPKTIDLNCDIGELLTGNNDAEIMELVSSVNISCGVHAGTAELTRRTIELARRAGRSIGAHPGMPGSFGRSEEPLLPIEAYEQVTQQVANFLEVARALGATVTHVKPHGSLYNQAEKSLEIANSIVRAIVDVDRRLTVYGLAEGQLVAAAAATGLPTVGEFFADRSYERDRTLTPRSLPKSVIHDPIVIRERTLAAIESSQVATRDGSLIAVNFQSICVHCDTQEALSIFHQLRAAFDSHGIEIGSAM